MKSKTSFFVSLTFFEFFSSFIFSSAFCFFYKIVLLLDAGPWAASSQGMQDESGAKSGNWLAEFVYVVST